MTRLPAATARDAFHMFSLSQARPLSLPGWIASQQSVVIARVLLAGGLLGLFGGRSPSASPRLAPRSSLTRSLVHSFTRSLAHSPMQDATSSPWLSNGAEGGEEDAWSNQESDYLSPHDDDADSLSHSLTSSSLPEPMDVLDGLSFGTSFFSTPFSSP